METPRRVLRNMQFSKLQENCTPLKIPASPFMKTLGFGTCVNVYKLELSPLSGSFRSPLAVKRVSTRFKDRKELFDSRLRKEAALLCKLSHPNIVGFRGIQCAEDGRTNLALECCTTCLGTILEEAQDSGKSGPLPANHIHRMIKDISSALDYLHMTAKLLHGDLKSFNVLVKGDFEICKLCDFGVSLPLDDDGTIDFLKHPDLLYVGTNCWSAPEVIDESNVIDYKADIFSFGLIIYETLALVPPHTLNMSMSVDKKAISFNDTVEEEEEVDKEYSVENENDEISNDNSELEQIDNLCGTRPVLPQTFELTEDYNLILELFYMCTNELSEDRPTAKIIYESVSEKI